MIARANHLLFGREEAKTTVLAYLKGCKSKDAKFFEPNSRKYSLLGVSGVKGIGKTELLAQICTKWAQEALGPKTKTLFVSYSGGGKAAPYCQQSAQFPADWVDSVGHLLLVSCGVALAKAKTFCFDDAIAYIRSQMDCEDEDTLVVCVDEIIELDLVNRQIYDGSKMTVAQSIMSRLHAEARRCRRQAHVCLHRYP